MLSFVQDSIMGCKTSSNSINFILASFACLCSNSLWAILTAASIWVCCCVKRTCNWISYRLLFYSRNNPLTLTLCCACKFNSDCLICSLNLFCWTFRPSIWPALGFCWTVGDKTFGTFGVLLCQIGGCCCCWCGGAPVGPGPVPGGTMLPTVIKTNVYVLLKASKQKKSTHIRIARVPFPSAIGSRWKIHRRTKMQTSDWIAASSLSSVRTLIHYAPQIPLVCRWCSGDFDLKGGGEARQLKLRVKLR